MKHLIHIMLLGLYLTGSSGLNIQFHYCGGDLSSFSVLLPADDCCDCESSSNCCSNESVVFQAADDHPPQQSLDLNLNWLLPEPQRIKEFTQNWVSRNITFAQFYADLPPPEIHLLNAVWII